MPADPPLVSVALCTFNGARYLREQLESLAAQDHPRLEIVAVDDASTDETVAILEAHAAADARLRVYRNAANVGYVRNFERALGLCRGDLIAPCDQDDVWSPNKLSALGAALGEAEAAFCDSELVDAVGHPLGRLSEKYRLGPIRDPAVFLFGTCISGHALLFRRRLVERVLPFPEGVYHDWWIGFAAASAAGIAYVPETLVRYRQHAASVTDLLHRRAPRTARRPGRKLAALAATEARLRAAAGYRFAADRAFHERTLGLWLAWRGQLFSPRFAAFAFRNRHRLFALQPDRRWRHAREALTLARGLRLRRLLTPGAYRAAEPARGGT